LAKSKQGVFQIFAVVPIEKSPLVKYRAAANHKPFVSHAPVWSLTNRLGKAQEFAIFL
jgi:hypothetical protein